MRNGIEFCSARKFQARGDLRSAVDLLSTFCQRNPGANEEVLELARLYLAAGEIRRAIATLQKVPTYEANPGLALRLSLERIWAGLCQTFDVVGAANEADRLIAGITEDDLPRAHYADARRIHARIAQFAIRYRELPNDRTSEVLRALELSALELEKAGWIEESHAAALEVAIWKSDLVLTTSTLDTYVREATARGQHNFAGHALLIKARRNLKLGGSSGEALQIVSAAYRHFAAIGNDLALIDAAHVEALVRSLHLKAPVSELEDVFAAYQLRHVPRSLHAVAVDLISAYRRAGQNTDADRYLAACRRITENTGLLMDQVIAEADLCEQNVEDGEAAAMSQCIELMQRPMPRLLRAHCQRMLSAAYRYAGDSQTANRHLSSSLKIFSELNAEDLASTAVSQATTAALSFATDTELEALALQAHEWSQRDASRRDYRAAAGKHQLRAKIALQRHRLLAASTPDSRFLDEADLAIVDGVAAASLLTDHTAATIFGSLAQLIGQIAVWRNAPERALSAYRNAIDVFEAAGHGLEAANSHFVIGCMHMKAADEAGRRGDPRKAPEHESLAQASLSAALSYYRDFGANRELVQALRNLSQLLKRRVKAGNSVSSRRICQQILQYLSEAEETLDVMRNAYSFLNPDDLKRSREFSGTENRQIYPLAISSELLLGADLNSIWTWQQKSRARVLIDALDGENSGIYADTTWDGFWSDWQDLELIEKDRGLSRRLLGARGNERRDIHEQRRALHQQMKKRVTLASYLERSWGHAPSADAIATTLCADADRRLIAVDFVQADSRIGIMLTDRNGIQPVHWLRAEPQLIVHHLELLRHSMDDPGAEATIHQSLEELALLITPLVEHTSPGDHLVLCPAGVLAALPLHALAPAGEPLISRNLVSYAASLSILKSVLDRRQDAAASTDYILYSPERTAPELSALYRVLSDKFKFRLLRGEDASINSLLTALKNGRVVHLNTGVTDEVTNPLRSHFVMNDGIISAGELTKTGRLAARLAIFDLIERTTIDGRTGAEPFGLAQLLLTAGIQSVIAPLGRIDAKSTAEYMETFYMHLTTQPRLCLAETLRRTQLTLRQKPHFQSGIKWAAFALYGDWRLT